MAIELVLTQRLAFYLALRQAEAFSCSRLRLLKWGLMVPEHLAAIRSGQAFAECQPQVVANTTKST